jgi:hypothetical protein
MTIQSSNSIIVDNLLIISAKELFQILVIDAILFTLYLQQTSSSIIHPYRLLLLKLLLVSPPSLSFIYSFTHLNCAYLKKESLPHLSLLETKSTQGFSDSWNPFSSLCLFFLATRCFF